MGRAVCSPVFRAHQTADTAMPPTSKTRTISTGRFQTRRRCEEAMDIRATRRCVPGWPGLSLRSPRFRIPRRGFEDSASATRTSPATRTDVDLVQQRVCQDIDVDLDGVEDFIATATTTPVRMRRVVQAVPRVENSEPAILRNAFEGTRFAVLGLKLGYLVDRVKNRMV